MEDYFPAPAGPSFEDGEEMDHEDGEAGGANDSQDILNGCLEKFSSPDFIMEPEIFSQLKKHLQTKSSRK